MRCGPFTQICPTSPDPWSRGGLAELALAHQSATPPPLRARAGDALSRLGDPRFDPQRLYLPAEAMLGFVHVPADPAYVIGTRRADARQVAERCDGQVYDDEWNDAPVAAPAFWIARYPVTVAQFRAYVAHTGTPVGDADALRDPDSRPVRWVSWHEALGYVRWLQAQLAASPLFDAHPLAALLRSGQAEVALPSELEWERAARAGQPGADYPWGNGFQRGRANTRDADIGSSSAVGCFAANPLGLHDMAGNVWEWTRSLWGLGKVPEFGYPYDPVDLRREHLDAGDTVSRVVRGGSWVNRRDLARCACRGRLSPGDRSSGLGFRVVLRSSPVS